MRRIKHWRSMEQVREDIDRDGEYRPATPFYQNYGNCEHCHLHRSLGEDLLCRECRKLLGAPPQ